MFDRVVARLRAIMGVAHARIRRWTRPSTRPVMGFVLDHFRSPKDLIRENPLLRKQLEVACRRIRRPPLKRTDRAVLVLLARFAPTWRQVVLLEGRDCAGKEGREAQSRADPPRLSYRVMEDRAASTGNPSKPWMAV